VVARYALVIALAACGKRDEHKKVATPATPPTEAGDDSAGACEQLPFAATTSVPEASGAAWMEIDGVLTLVVTADSGHDGMFGFVDPETGVTRTSGTFPLGTGASDDIEGLASRGKRLYGITSSGYMREWEWQAGAFVLVAGPYAIGGQGVVCKNPEKSNCGKNYEGLALAPAPIGECVGYACSKETGQVFCLADQGGRLAATSAPGITIIDKKDVLADCAFGDKGELYVGNNLFGLARTFRVENLADPAQVAITDLGPLGTGFPETVAARGDIVYRMSDMGGDGPSLMLKFRCPVAGR
jgi:hypothetical protein